jgi:succinate dehydrogenase flavin-adding protein (antitoxin of CptAB toxin-antitoxin module)
VNCNCLKNDDGEYYKCTCDYSAYFPLYLAHFSDKKEYYLHPDEKEHIERFLAGTDNPLYDLVHELRYNPKFALDKDVQEAQERDKKRRK